MCFMLYAGTSTPIPRKPWNQEIPEISVQDLKGDEARICVHFTKPAVQNIGSTSCCGCDFPSAMYQNGGWPEIEYSEPDEEQQKSEQFNIDGLANLLKSVKDEWVELYGVWAGNYSDPPAIHEEIDVTEIVIPRFRFKERGFYRVRLLPGL